MSFSPLIGLILLLWSNINLLQLTLMQETLFIESCFLTGMKRKFLCPNLPCLVFTGGRGRTPRTSWMSSFACLVSMGNMMRTLQALRTTPCTMLVHLPVLTRMKVLLRHTLEATAPGHNGIDLHLGQKPKLGGRYTDITHSSIYHILSVLCISMCCFSFFL